LAAASRVLTVEGR